MIEFVGFLVCDGCEKRRKVGLRLGGATLWSFAGFGPSFEVRCNSDGKTWMETTRGQYACSKRCYRKIAKPEEVKADEVKGWPENFPEEPEA